MIKNISIGIDVGSATIRVVVGEFVKGEKNPKIVGVGEAPSLGLRHGYVTDADLAAKSIRAAVQDAEKSCEFKIKKAFLSLSGATLRGDTSSGSTIISKADGEVTNLDINKTLQDCEDNLNLGNKKIIHVFPTQFRLDGKEVMGRMEGLRGTKIEAKALFITYSMVHLEDLLGAVAEAGVDVIDVIAAPIAASNIVLSDKQKIVGVALVDIGAETTSLSVFEDGKLMAMHSFSIGGTEVTNDIALGFKISLDEANQLKLGSVGGDFSEKKLHEIIEARLCDIFESIDNHLKKIKRSELLPAGIVFIGGAANTPGLLELSKSVLKLPASIGSPEVFGNTKTKLRDPSWFTALGLLTSNPDGRNFSDGSFKHLLRDFKNTIKSSVKQFMP